MKTEKSEMDLIKIAEQGDDKEATEAMILLRTLYDPTYIWCSECDYIVIKAGDCCLEQRENNNLTDISF